MRQPATVLTQQGLRNRGSRWLPRAVRVDPARNKHNWLPSCRWDGPQTAGLWHDGGKDDPLAIGRVLRLCGAQFVSLIVGQLFHPCAIRVHAIQVRHLAALGEREQRVGVENDLLPVRGPVRVAGDHVGIGQPPLSRAVGVDGVDSRPCQLAACALICLGCFTSPAG